MKFLLGLWVIGVCLWDILAVLGIVKMSPTLGYCLISVVPLLMYDVVGYFSMEKHLLALMFVGTMDDKDPNLTYKVSVHNAVLSAIFVEMIFPPIVMLASETYCPVGKKAK